MPPADPDRRPNEEFDPEKTFFFKRRKQSVNFLPLAVVCALVLGSGVLIVWALTRSEEKPGHGDAAIASEKLHQTDQPMLSPEEARKPENAPRALPANPLHSSPVPFDATKPVRAALPPNPSPPSFDATKPVRAALPIGTPDPDPADGDSPPPATSDPASPLNLDLNDPGNARVRADVLHRVDLMPGVSDANKDKLYASVDHARNMGRLITIPFVKGENTLRPSDVDRLKAQLASPPVRQTLEDPTVVFVILGYADPKGSDKLNAEISLARARAVLDALRDRCGILNVMHAVAMGGSTLFSTQQAEKNRVVEVWAVLP